jgi:hypothetical protein
MSIVHLEYGNEDTQHSAVNISGNKKEKGANPVPQPLITTRAAFHNRRLYGLSTDSLALSFILYRYKVPVLSIKCNMYGVT